MRGATPIVLLLAVAACEDESATGTIPCARTADCPEGLFCSRASSASEPRCFDRAPSRACWPSSPEFPFFSAFAAETIFVRSVAAMPGRVCAAGGFTGTLGAVTGRSDAFVACWADGAMAIATSAGDGIAEYRDVAIGSDGTVYATGFVDGSESFGSSSRAAIGPDVVVAAYGPELASEPRWVAFAGNDGSNVATSIDADGTAICVAGASAGRMELAPGTLAIGGATQDGFLACFDPAGRATLAADVIVTSGDDAVYDVAVDGGSIYLAGEIAAGTSFDAWFGLYAGGTLAASRTITDAGAPDADAARVIAIGDGAIYAGGFLAGANETPSPIATTSARAGFLARLGATDLAVERVELVADSAMARAEVLGLAVDRDCVFVSGWFDGRAECGLSSVGSRDVFLAGFDRDLYPLGARGFGSTGEDRAEGLASTISTGPLLAGSIAGEATFGVGMTSDGAHGVVASVAAP